MGTQIASVEIPIVEDTFGEAYNATTGWRTGTIPTSGADRIALLLTIDGNGNTGTMNLALQAAMPAPTEAGYPVEPAESDFASVNKVVSGVVSLDEMQIDLSDFSAEGSIVILLDTAGLPFVRLIGLVSDDSDQPIVSIRTVMANGNTSLRAVASL